MLSFESLRSARSALNVAFSNGKAVIHAKEQSCNRYPEVPGSPTLACAECGLGEIYGRGYDASFDHVILENDHRAFQTKVREGAVSITLLGGEMLQGIKTQTPWPSLDDLKTRFGIKPQILERLVSYREKLGKPIVPGTPMEIWERDGLLATAMISSLGMAAQITSNFDLFRRRGNKEVRLQEIIDQLKIAGVAMLNVSWHTVAGTTLTQNQRYFEHLVSAIKYCERVAHIPTVLTRVFRGFEADPDILRWQREVSNRYITNDISPAGIKDDDRKTVFYGSNQELKPAKEEIEILSLYHLLNAMAGDQPRVKTVFQAIFESVLAETGWRCDAAEENFEFIEVTKGAPKSGVCSEVRGKVIQLFPGEKEARMGERTKLIRELCPSCLSRCYTYFEWRKFQKDALHMWHYAQAAGKIWRQLYGRERPFRHLVMKAADYTNPDLLERIIQFRYRYFAKSLENEEVLVMLRRSGVDPIATLQKLSLDAQKPEMLIARTQSYFGSLPAFADETSLQSRMLRQFAKVQQINSDAVSVPWKYIWTLRKENRDDLTYLFEKTRAHVEGNSLPPFPIKGTILAQIVNLFFPRYSFLMQTTTEVD